MSVQKLNVMHKSMVQPPIKHQIINRINPSVRPVGGRDTNVHPSQAVANQPAGPMDIIHQGYQWPSLEDARAVYADFREIPRAAHAGVRGDDGVTTTSHLQTTSHGTAMACLFKQPPGSPWPEVEAQQLQAIDEEIKQEFQETWSAAAFTDTQSLEYSLHISCVNGFTNYLDPQVSFKAQVKQGFCPHTRRQVPMATAILLTETIQGVPSARPLRALFDTGGTGSFASESILPRKARVTPRPAVPVNTLGGRLTTSGSIRLEGLRFPEFDARKRVDKCDFRTFNTPCAYDVIFGADFLAKMELIIDFKSLTLSWLGSTIPISTEGFPKSRLATMIHEHDIFLEEEEFGDDFDGFDQYAADLLDAKYELVTPRQIIERNCQHLTPSQQDDLEKLFEKHSKLFDGTLGKFDGPPMDLQLLPGAKPVYRRPYPVPHNQLGVFQRTLNQMVAMGVLSPCGESAWSLPTFLVAKKDGRVRWVSNFIELNKVIELRSYILPIITDILRRHHGWRYFSKIDISM